MKILHIMPLKYPAHVRVAMSLEFNVTKLSIAIIAMFLFKYKNKISHSIQICAKAIYYKKTKKPA